MDQRVELGFIGLCDYSFTSSLLVIDAGRNKNYNLYLISIYKHNTYMVTVRCSHCCVFCTRRV